jgi:hypothetical protein
MGHRGIDRARLTGFLRAISTSFPLERALVFGSRARGDELLDSDYDLILISPAFEGIAWPDRVREVMNLWEMDVGLQPLCYTPDEFARKSAEISVVAEAIREGVAV